MGRRLSASDWIPRPSSHRHTMQLEAGVHVEVMAHVEGVVAVAAVVLPLQWRGTVSEAAVGEGGEAGAVALVAAVVAELMATAGVVVQSAHEKARVCCGDKHQTQTVEFPFIVRNIVICVSCSVVTGRCTYEQQQIVA